MKKILMTVLCALVFISGVCAQTAPKREFRGAWIQCVNGQWLGLSPQQMQARLTRHLDALQKINVNAVMFQVRAEADALYQSSYEPWSRFLTGKQGVAPNPYWDPLQWMIEQCHKRGMECHAWINPYRAKTKDTHELSTMHPYVQHPERFFNYGDLLIFHPGLKENRDYICKIVHDILNRYDVDGLHMDDYFYPYPQAGVDIPDAEQFQRFGAGFSSVADWRRDNVNRLIQELHDTIRAVKPWVKFGVSPFGIYHNHREGDVIPGSATRGSENYNALYADVLKWVNNGWVDYNIPQLYWNIGFKVADYEELINFWAKYSSNRPLYIGQDITRSVKEADPRNSSQNQLPAKFAMQRSLPTVNGSCIWYSAVIADNLGGSADYLANTFHKYPALQPAMPFIDAKVPNKVKGLRARWMPDGYYLMWLEPKGELEMDRATRYVVYRFAKGEKVDISDPSHIIMITDQTCIKLPYTGSKEKFTYCVTALDRMQNESKVVKKKVRL